MSWVSDFLENPQKSVDNALGTNFSGQGPGGFASSGDLAKYLGLQTKAMSNIVRAPIEAGLDLAKGDTKSAGSRFVKSAGSVAYLASPGSNWWATDSGQKILRDTKVGANYAGYNAGLVQARDTGTMSNQYRDETIRFGAEAAVVGGGIYAYNNPVFASDVGYLSGKEILSGTGTTISNWWAGTSAKDAVLYASAAKGLAKSDNPLKEITKEILGDDIADIIFPSNPTQPDVTNPSDPSEFGPWQNPEFTGSSPLTSVQGAINGTSIMVIGAGILITYLVLKRIS